MAPLANQELVNFLKILYIYLYLNLYAEGLEVYCREFPGSGLHADRPGDEVALDHGEVESGV